MYVLSVDVLGQHIYSERYSRYSTHRCSGLSGCRRCSASAARRARRASAARRRRPARGSVSPSAAHAAVANVPGAAPAAQLSVSETQPFQLTNSSAKLPNSAGNDHRCLVTYQCEHAVVVAQQRGRRGERERAAQQPHARAQAAPPEQPAGALHHPADTKSPR